MNVLYLKYALEVAKTGSINKAAENLYMAQPNLSRSIKELENSLGIAIFERTSKGMVTTQEGEILLMHAEEILRRVDEVENMFRDGQTSKILFSLSAPYSFYVSRAFSNFSQTLSRDKMFEILYEEANALDTIGNIFHAECKVGVVRYATQYNRLFQKVFEEKGLLSEMITEFSQKILVSKKHPLAKTESISREDIIPFTELVYSDLQVPSIPTGDVRREELDDAIERRIFVNDRASCLELLSSNTDVFYRSEPMMPDVLDRFGLVQKNYSDSTKLYRDVLIYRKDYKLSKYDKAFITELCNVKRKCFTE